MTSVEKRRSGRKSGGHRKHSDGGYSDTSSGGSFLDETDREVSNLTDRAFRSLCIGDEAVYNDSDLCSSSPCIQRDRQLAFSQSVQDREDREREELKRAAHESFSFRVQQYGQDWIQGGMYGAEIHRDPQWEVYGERTQGRVSATFQHSFVETSQQEESLRDEQLPLLSNGATELSSQQRRSRSRVSSLIRAFNSEGSRDGVGMDGKLREWNDETSWDKSALMSIQRELSEFSYQQNFNSGHFPSAGTFSSRDNNFYSSEVAAHMNSASSFMRSSHSKHSMSAQVNCNSNFFIHSEFSPFKVWRDHNRFPFQQGEVSGFMHCSEFPKWYETPMYKELSLEAQPQGPYRFEERGIRHPRNNFAPVVPPAPSRSTSTSTVLQKALAVEKRCESELAGHYPHRKRTQSLGSNRLPSQRPSTASPTIEMSRRVQETISSVKALQQKIKMMTAQNIATGMTGNQQGVLCSNNNLIPFGNDAQTVAPNVVSSNTSTTPFNISQLLTPLVHANQEEETSEVREHAVSPQPVEHAPVRAESRGATPDVRMASYKSRATSLLFNLKDNRKRVKSTYSPPKFKGLETLEKNKQPSIQEPRDTVIDIPDFPDPDIQFPQVEESSRTNAALHQYANQYHNPGLSLNSQLATAHTGQYSEYTSSDYQTAQMQGEMFHHSGFTGFIPENYAGNQLANGQNLHEDLSSFTPYKQGMIDNVETVGGDVYRLKPSYTTTEMPRLNADNNQTREYLISKANTEQHFNETLGREFTKEDRYQHLKDNKHDYSNVSSQDSWRQTNSQDTENPNLKTAISPWKQEITALMEKDQHEQAYQRAAEIYEELNLPRDKYRGESQPSINKEELRESFDVRTSSHKKANLVNPNISNQPPQYAPFSKATAENPALYGQQQPGAFNDKYVLQKYYGHGRENEIKDNYSTRNYNRYTDQENQHTFYSNKDKTMLKRETDPKETIPKGHEMQSLQPIEAKPQFEHNVQENSLSNPNNASAPTMANEVEHRQFYEVKAAQTMAEHLKAQHAQAELAKAQHWAQVEQPKVESAGLNLAGQTGSEKVKAENAKAELTEHKRVNQAKAGYIEDKRKEEQTGQSREKQSDLVREEQTKAEQTRVQKLTEKPNNIIEEAGAEHMREVQGEHVKAEPAEAEKLKEEHIKTELAKSEQARIKQAKTEQAIRDRIKAEQLEEEQVRAGQVERERMEAERIRTEKVKAEQAEAERRKAEQAKLEQIKEHQARAEQAKLEQIKEQQAKAEQAKLEQIKEQQAKAEQAKLEQIKEQQAKAEQAKLEQIKEQQAKAEQAKLEQIKEQQAKAEQAKLEQIKEQQARAEQAKLEQIKEQQARAEQAKLEQIKEQQARAEQAKLEQIKEQQAKAEQAKLELIKEQQAKAEQAKLEQIKEQQARAEQAKIEQIKEQQAKAEQAKLELIKEQQAKAEQAKLEQIKEQQARAEQAKLQQLKEQQAKAEQAKLEQIKEQQAKAEQAKLEQIKEQQARAEQAKLQQIKEQQAKAEQAKLEQLKEQQAKAEQAKIEQIKEQQARAEQARLEQIKEQQAKAEQAKLEQIKEQQARAEQAKLEQLKEQQAKAEQAKLEQIKEQQAKAEQAKLQQIKEQQARAEQAKLELIKEQQAKAEQAKLEQIKEQQARAEQAKLQQLKEQQAKAEQAKLEQIKEQQAKAEQAKLEQIKEQHSIQAGQVNAEQPTTQISKAKEKKVDQMKVELAKAELAKTEYMQERSAKPAAKLTATQQFRSEPDKVQQVKTELAKAKAELAKIKEKMRGEQKERVRNSILTKEDRIKKDAPLKVNINKNEEHKDQDQATQMYQQREDSVVVSKQSTDQTHRGSHEYNRLREKYGFTDTPLTNTHQLSAAGSVSSSDTNETPALSPDKAETEKSKDKYSPTSRFATDNTENKEEVGSFKSNEVTDSQYVYSESSKEFKLSSADYLPTNVDRANSDTVTDKAKDDSVEKLDKSDPLKHNDVSQQRDSDFAKPLSLERKPKSSEHSLGPNKDLHFTPPRALSHKERAQTKQEILTSKIKAHAEKEISAIKEKGFAIREGFISKTSAKHLAGGQSLNIRQKPPSQEVSKKHETTMSSNTTPKHQMELSGIQMEPVKSVSSPGSATIPVKSAASTSQLVDHSQKHVPKEPMKSNHSVPKPPREAKQTGSYIMNTAEGLVENQKKENQSRIRLPTQREELAPRNKQGKQEANHGEISGEQKERLKDNPAVDTDHLNKKKENPPQATALVKAENSKPKMTEKAESKHEAVLEDSAPSLNLYFGQNETPVADDNLQITGIMVIVRERKPSVSNDQRDDSTQEQINAKDKESSNSEMDKRHPSSGLEVSKGNKSSKEVSRVKANDRVVQNTHPTVKEDQTKVGINNHPENMQETSTLETKHNNVSENIIVKRTNLQQASSSTNASPQRETQLQEPLAEKDVPSTVTVPAKNKVLAETQPLLYKQDMIARETKDYTNESPEENSVKDIRTDEIKSNTDEKNPQKGQTTHTNENFMAKMVNTEINYTNDSNRVHAETLIKHDAQPSMKEDMTKVINPSKSRSIDGKNVPLLEEKRHDSTPPKPLNKTSPSSHLTENENIHVSPKHQYKETHIGENHQVDNNVHIGSIAIRVVPAVTETYNLEMVGEHDVTSVPSDVLAANEHTQVASSIRVEKVNTVRNEDRTKDLTLASSEKQMRDSLENKLGVQSRVNKQPDSLKISNQHNTVNTTLENTQAENGKPEKVKIQPLEGDYFQVQGVAETNNEPHNSANVCGDTSDAVSKGRELPGLLQYKAAISNESYNEEKNEVFAVDQSKMKAVESSNQDENMKRKNRETEDNLASKQSDGPTERHKNEKTEAGQTNHIRKQHTENQSSLSARDRQSSRNSHPTRENTVKEKPEIKPKPKERVSTIPEISAIADYARLKVIVSEDRANTIQEFPPNKKEGFFPLIQTRHSRRPVFTADPQDLSVKEKSLPNKTGVSSKVNKEPKPLVFPITEKEHQRTGMFKLGDKERQEKMLLDVKANEDVLDTGAKHAQHLKERNKSPTTHAKNQGSEKHAAGTDTQRVCQVDQSIHQPSNPPLQPTTSSSAVNRPRNTSVSQHLNSIDNSNPHKKLEQSSLIAVGIPYLDNNSHPPSTLGQMYNTEESKQTTPRKDEKIDNALAKIGEERPGKLRQERLATPHKETTAKQRRAEQLEEEQAPRTEVKEIAEDMKIKHILEESRASLAEDQRRATKREEERRAREREAIAIKIKERREKLKEAERRAEEERKAKQTEEEAAQKEEEMRAKQREGERMRETEEKRRIKIEEERRAKLKEEEEEEQQRRAALIEEQQRRAAQEEQQRRAALIEEQQRRAAQEEEKRRAALIEEQQRRVAQEEEKRRSALIEEQQRRVAQEEEKRRSALIEEQQRRAAQEEQQRRAAQEEQQRRAAHEEQQRIAAQEELQRRAAQEELQRRAAHEEQQRIAAQEELQRRAAQEEEQKRKAAQEEQQRRAAQRKELRRAALIEEQQRRAALIEEQRREKQIEEKRLIGIEEEKQRKQREEEERIKQTQEQKKADQQTEEQRSETTSKERAAQMEEQKRAVQRMDALQYYAINSAESERKPKERQICSPLLSQRRNNPSGLESTEDSHTRTYRPHAAASPAPSLPRSNTSSPALGVKPSMFRVKDNTLRGSSFTKSVKPRFHKNFGDDFRVGSPMGSERGEEEHETIRRSAGTPADAGLNRLGAIKESSTFQPASSSQDYSTPLPYSRPYSRRSFALDEDDSRSVFSYMSEDVESFATSAADLADLRGLYDYDRPESACSFSSDVSRSLGKPPVVPPKSEKALRRAKRLTTRRIKKELSKGVEDSPAGVEKPLQEVSSIPSSSSTEVRSTNRHAVASPHFSAPVSLTHAPTLESSLPSSHTGRRSSHSSFYASPHATGPTSLPVASPHVTAPVSIPVASPHATGPASNPAAPKTIADVPSSPTLHHANQPAPVTQYHVESSYPQSYPLTQRKVLQDLGSGQYFVVDVPVQVKTKTFFDPETGKYVQLNVRESAKNTSQPQPLQTYIQPELQPQIHVKPQQQPISQDSPALYQGYHGYPQGFQPSAINSVPHNRSSAPVTLHQDQQPVWEGHSYRYPANEMGQNSEGHCYSPEKTPYMDTVNDTDKTYNTVCNTHAPYESFPECDANSQLAGSLVCENDNSAHSRYQPRDIITMSDLDDFMEVSDW